MPSCEHCGNPDKSKWTTDCQYKGSFPSRKAFVRSTSDAPCACDAYDAFVRARGRRDALTWMFVFVVLAAIGAAILIF